MNYRYWETSKIIASSVGFFFGPLSKIIIHYTLLNFPHFLLDQLTEELFISNGTILQTRQFYYVCIFHATTSGRSFATFSFLFFRQSSQDFFLLVWSYQSKSAAASLARLERIKPPSQLLWSRNRKNNRILTFLQKYQYANCVILKICIERIPESNTEQRRVLSISLIFDIPNTKNIPKTDDGRERFSFSSQILLCWQLLLRCVFWNAAAVQHIHKPYKARGGQFYGFIRGAVFYLHGLKIHGA